MGEYISRIIANSDGVNSLSFVIYAVLAVKPAQSRSTQPNLFTYGALLK
jgi:hypothetical protein